MKITRRKFILATPVVAGAVLGLQGIASGQQKTGGRGGLFQLPSSVAADPLSQLTWNSFYPFQGTEFLFHVSGGDIPLTLESMVDTKPKNLERINIRKGECFMLKFTDAGRIPLKAGTYDVNHFRLGDFKLFITVGGQVGRKKYYIAVINRVVS